MSEYEYRIVYRRDGSEWYQLNTNRGQGRPFRTLAGARGVITRETKVEAQRPWRIKQWGPIEFNIQRRPVSTDWEDVT